MLLLQKDAIEDYKCFSQEKKSEILKGINTLLAIQASGRSPTTEEMVANLQGNPIAMTLYGIALTEGLKGLVQLLKTKNPKPLI